MIFLCLPQNFLSALILQKKFFIYAIQALIFYVIIVNTYIMEFKFAEMIYIFFEVYHGNKLYTTFLFRKLY